MVAIFGLLLLSVGGVTGECVDLSRAHDIFDVDALLAGDIKVKGKTCRRSVHRAPTPSIRHR